ncbi:hypothetical protein [Crossiella sp. CA198]
MGMLTDRAAAGLPEMALLAVAGNVIPPRPENMKKLFAALAYPD